ncbi:MAG: glycerol-3-phosphate dehydrogenase/oxidase [Chitinophagales bacterium]|nr:glycerol-3-phosphate dehydrogenase/oxidase [Chitinophagales bacterium]
MTFSAKNRGQLIDDLEKNEFDLLIIGGGITGAGIALDASLRGLKVALVEKEDFASGTSSRSTKLIHGGLRYLKQLEFGIVKETGHERAILHQNAPHLVYPEKMILPIIQGGSLGRYSTSLGLYAYDYLAGVKRKERRKMLNKKGTMNLEPLLREEILLGSGVYIEYRSDDARLVVEVLKTAFTKGAIAVNYVKAEKLTYENGIVNGAVLYDDRSEYRFKVKAKKIINATGPWVDEIREDDKSLSEKKLHLTKGVHIVINRDRLPISHAVYFDVPTDKRMVFAIPRQNVVYIGTTDTNYTSDKNHVYADAKDVSYLLRAANYIFPRAKLVMDDICSSWAGLRPLIHEEGKGPSELSRKDEIFISKSGLISIAGGKLTGYRKMAERTVDVALKQLNQEEGMPYVACSTIDTILAGGDILGQKTLNDFIEKLSKDYPTFNRKEIIILAHKYGSNAVEILKTALLKQGDGNTLLNAEIDYCIENEMCSNLSDFIIRRTGRLYFERPSLEKLYPYIHQYIMQTLCTNDVIRERDLKTFEKEFRASLEFKFKKETI